MKEIRQLSKGGQSICIELRSGFVVLIDFGFYDPFKRNVQLSPKENILEYLKLHFPFARLDLIDVIQLDNFEKGQYALDMDAIKYYWEDEVIYEENKGYFGLDTATILVIDFEDFELFTKTMYDGLYEKSKNNEDLILRMNEIIGHKSFAIIECPGVGSGYDFEGDGSYFIEKKEFKRVN